ncbi:hypothetical protein Tco_1293007 [Tanacetum coccineum]
MRKDDRLRVIRGLQRVKLLEHGLSRTREMLMQTNQRSFDVITAKVKMIFRHLIKSVIEELQTSAVFMACLTSYDSNVLSEYSEQPVFVNDSNIEITSDNNVISYDQYMKENESEVVKGTTSSEQQNAMIMSVIDEMSNQVAKCNAVN